MILYYDSHGFHGEQDENNTRIVSSSEERDLLFNEINSRSSEDNLQQTVGIVIGSDSKLRVSTIPRTLEEQQGIIRRLRANRVFPIVNRSQMWFNSLTATQNQELQTWYQAWLDAPDTLVIPERPAWLG